MDIRDYRVLDRSNLIVYGRPKSRSYLLKISPQNLDNISLDMISFKSWSGRVCGFAGDELIIPKEVKSIPKEGNVDEVEPGRWLLIPWHTLPVPRAAE